MAKRQNLQKMAAFNLGVSEALHDKKRQRDTEFHVSNLLLVPMVTVIFFGVFFTHLILENNNFVDA